MEKYLILIVHIPILIISCNTNMKENSVEKWKSEIIQTEKEFADMAKKEGISKAFLNYAADDVVLLRDNSLILGKEALRESFVNPEESSNTVSLVWEPDFADVALSGDLGYTYGKYTYTVKDSIGNRRKSEGIFHTVWKRQQNGKWKFVWD